LSLTHTTNLYQTFLRTVQQQPEAMACLDLGRDQRWTYGRLSDRISEAADRLDAAGIRRGQCIGLHYGSGLDYIVWAYAIWRCGATVVPIATELAADEKAEVCSKIKMDAIVARQGEAKVFEAFLAGPAHALEGAAIWLPLATQFDHPAQFLEVDAAFIRFTSGTTSTAKGVVLSHETVHDRIHAANDALEIGPEDRVVWLLSMSYHFTVSIVSYLTFGATIILCSDHFGSTIVEEAAAEGATLIYGSPQHYSFMASDRTDTRLDNLRLAISTASSLKSEIAAAFLKRFGIALSQAYGIIEVGLPCINLLGESAKPGSVGRVLPAYEIRLIDAGAGDAKAIEVRGKGIVDAYYNPWKPRSEIMTDGWFATGDIGRFDEDGYLFITGRSKEMISVGGMKFFPQEVEAVLESHADVAEAYVYAEAHARLGEVPHALVVAPLNVSTRAAVVELRDYCLLHLTAFKVPQRIEYVDELPRTASGKLRRGTAPPRRVPESKEPND